MVYEHRITTSTMDDVRRLSDAGAPAWTVVRADTQTTGRGTRGRGWVSPAGSGLWASILLPVDCACDDLILVPRLAAETLASVLPAIGHASLEVKEPNDLMLDGAKLAGFLTETVYRGAELRTVILGLGVNLTASPDELLSQGLTAAASWAATTGTTLEPRELLDNFLISFRRRYEREFAPSLTVSHISLPSE